MMFESSKFITFKNWKTKTLSIQIYQDTQILISQSSRPEGNLRDLLLDKSMEKVEHTRLM